MHHIQICILQKILKIKLMKASLVLLLQLESKRKICNYFDKVEYVLYPKELSLV